MGKREIIGWKGGGIGKERKNNRLREDGKKKKEIREAGKIGGERRKMKDG
jgi:hypothetical protein